MTVYTFQLVTASGAERTVSIEADFFMQAFDIVVAYYPNYLTLTPLTKGVTV